jgi:parvulin-like peptidyl-prolyl isomerase
MKRSRVLVRPSVLLLAALVLSLSASSRAEIIERIVARVNGDIITLSELESRQLAAVQQARIPPEQVETYLRENNARILQDAIDDLLVVQRAADLGIRLRPEYVQEVIEGIKKENNIADDAELRTQLRKEGMSLDDLKRNIERSVLRRQVLSRELEPKTQVTEAEARAVYEKSKADFGKSAAVHLQEIVVADEALARDIVRRARGGEDFSALARAHSTAGSKAAGGELGRVAKGDMAPQLEKVVSALPAGGISEPIAIEGGYRIVRVVSKEEASTTPFEEVKDEILKRLSQERMAKVYEDYVEGLRTASKQTTHTMVNEVSLQVPNVAAPILTGPGLTGAPAPGAAPSPAAGPAVPALPGVDASEISTTPQAKPERVAPPSAPGQAAAPSTPASPATTPSPAPSPSPGA